MTTATNIEARALANILALTADFSLQAAYRETAAEARAGGRALTTALAHFAGPSVSREMMVADPAKTWHYHIDPAGSYQYDDPRRNAEARTIWRRIAQREAGLDRFRSDRIGARSPDIQAVMVQDAEAMLSWPIYRAAIAGVEPPQVYVNVSGGVAEATVTRGEVDVIEHDWDNLRDEGDYDWDDLQAMREKLSRVANSEYRARLLADIDEVIERSGLVDPELAIPHMAVPSEDGDGWDVIEVATEKVVDNYLTEDAAKDAAADLSKGG